MFTEDIPRGRKNQYVLKTGDWLGKTQIQPGDGENPKEGIYDMQGYPEHDRPSYDLSAKAGNQPLIVAASRVRQAQLKNELRCYRKQHASSQIYDPQRIERVELEPLGQ